MSNQQTRPDFTTIKRHERLSPDVIRYYGIARGRPIVVDQIRGTDLVDGVERTIFEFVFESGEDASPTAVAAVEAYGFRDDEPASTEAAER